jgi:uncharacterized protein
MKKIVITGGTGAIGKNLAEKLTSLGYEVFVLTRNPTEKFHRFWDIKTKQMEETILDDLYALVHLAGENLGEKHWIRQRKKDLLESRVKTMNFIYEKCQEKNRFPKIVVSASGVGYYGAVSTEKIYTEEDFAAKDFLGNLCQKWEEAALKFQAKSERIIIFRTAMVLSNQKNGALQKMMLPFKMGLGAPLASGNQYLPWICLDDIISLYVDAIENAKITGIYNAVAPQHITNKEFSRQLAKTMKKPFFMPAVPQFVLKLLLGEMEQIVSQGSRISSDKILSTGFQFKFDSLEKGLADLLDF